MRAVRRGMARCALREADGSSAQCRIDAHRTRAILGALASAAGTVIRAPCAGYRTSKRLWGAIRRASLALAFAQRRDGAVDQRANGDWLSEDDRAHGAAAADRAAPVRVAESPRALTTHIRGPHMTANVLPFPSRRLPIDPERREVVKVVGLRDAFDVQLNHEGGSGDHVAVFPAQPRHPRRPKMRTGLGIGERALPLPLLQFSGSSLHSKAGNTMRYNLTIPCNAIRSCVVTATVLSFLRMEDMPNRILELRRAAKLSQEELGFRVGVSKMQISGMERGKRELSLGMMRRLAEALDVSPADLLCDEDNPMRLATDERALLSRYRAADPEQQRNIERVTEALVPFNQRQRDAA
ncbi:hypothetical protein EMGR_006551 [Emarellia grisea]